HLVLAVPLRLHGNCEERVILDGNRDLLDRRDEEEFSVLLAPQHRGEQLHERLPADRTALVEPGPVAGDCQADIAAEARALFAAGPVRCYDSFPIVPARHSEPPPPPLPLFAGPGRAQGTFGHQHYCDRFFISKCSYRPVLSAYSSPST